jgi:hypothetical protein
VNKISEVSKKTIVVVLSGGALDISKIKDN